MDEASPTQKPPIEPRIQWTRSDEEAFEPRRGRLNRANSSASITSNRSGYSLSRRHSVDPAVALPITYRTVSFNLEDSKARELVELNKAKDKTTAELADLEWHTISPEELYRRLSISFTQGLSSEQIKRRLEEYGKNVPTHPPNKIFQKIFGYFFYGFGSILLVASILVWVSWKPLGDPPAVANLALAIVLLAVFFIQAAFNAWQDWSSSQVMASITAMLPDDCLLVRDGTQVHAVASDIVPGDVLLIRAGNKLPADVRLVDVSSDVKFDRAILTGESLPVPGTVDSTDNNYLETRCIGMQGTHCISGSAIGIVVATADKTVFGRIAKLTNEPKTGLTTLEKEVLRFVIIIVLIMLANIILVIIVWASWLRKDHHNWINVPTLIVDCVSVAVAFIPEGLPIALTASLTITANLMRKVNVLCKSLKTVETLGAVSVICSDKTGTLTKNEMYVTQCAAGITSMAPPTSLEGGNNERPGISQNAIDQMRAIAGLCNSGEFDAATRDAPLAERKINGDATDQAVLRFSEGLGSVAELRVQWKKTFELAFNSKNKFMIRTYSMADWKGLSMTLPLQDAAAFGAEDMLLTIKGAPDVLMPKCSLLMNALGETQPLDESAKITVENIKNAWSAQGKRVILLARKAIPQSEIKSAPSSAPFESEVMEHARTGLTLVGLVGITDPPRPEIPEVVRTLRAAGIRIFMVTGDFTLTAQAIAAECGIITNPPERVDGLSALSRDGSGAFSKSQESDFKADDDAPCRSIAISGPELLAMNDVQWKQLCKYDEIVFARTTPEQKLRIVREFQSCDEIVGMTGDGVNDAPSLKAADIGIALGSGSDIAIEASDMVLLDSFSAVVNAVEHGRTVFDNLKKTICYLLPAGSFSEFWPVITNVLFGLPQILSSFLMIIICCFTDCAAATALAYEKPEADVLLRKPRRPKKDHLVDWKLILQAYGFLGVLETVLSFTMSYWYLQRKGIPFSSLWFGFGALPASVDQDYYTARLNEASSIYFINLVVMQWFNLMATRTRRLSIFQHPPAFNKATQNLLLFPAILFALGMAILWLYIPGLQRTLNTSNVPVEHFFLPAAQGLGVLLLDEIRKYCVRRWPKGVLAKIAW